MRYPRPVVLGRALALGVVVLTACETVDETGPTVDAKATIFSPAADASFPIGTPIRFSGTAVGADGQTLAGPSLTWESSLDGALGKGWWIERGDLKAGTHRVTLKATDATGQTRTAAITVVIIGTGTIDVTARTTGTNLDPDGYTVSAGGVSAALGVNGSASLREVAPGARPVTLSGLASNCRVSGSNPVSVTVAAAATHTVAFTVVCEATFGSIRVAAVTTGDAPDPDGYIATVDGRSAAVPTNGSTTIADIGAGPRSVTLSGLASTCSVTGANPATVTVAGGAVATVTFDVACTARGTGVRITTTTTGAQLDPDGYLVTVGGVNRPIPVNGTLTVTDLTAGTQVITLGDVAGNCTVGRNPVGVQLIEGVIAEISFAVTCTGAQPPSFATDILPLFNNAAMRAGGGPACTGCHFAGSNFGGLALAGPTAYDGARARVIPGDVTRGRLICRVTLGTRSGCTQNVPDHDPRNPMGLVQSAIDRIDAWILAGAPPE